jgi:N-acyl homoserine lactone hydrolase
MAAFAFRIPGISRTHRLKHMHRPSGVDAPEVIGQEMQIQEVAMKVFSALITLLTFSLLVGPAAAQAKLERLYVIECGERTAPDVAPWTPGVNVGKPVDFVDNCYLIKHGTDWMVWDTGLTDAIFNAPSSEPNAWKRNKSLAGELDKIGVKPSDIKYIAVSHTHPDHIGNVELFPQALLLVQKSEYDWPGTDGKPRFLPSHPVKTLEIGRVR